ncbi:MAG TPA: AAA family ATPase [Streptosporangiaceae bacterium]|jgi:DNA-binding CsgD family transcriptional regulator
MAALMIERDAVMEAVRVLLDRAAGGRGGALFVIGEAGLGKTTVLAHAAGPSDRFTVGTGRADVAEAALPFGLIGQALDGVADIQAGLPGAAGQGAIPAPADYYYAVLGGLRRAAGHGPLLLALDDAHWADRDSLTLLRLICRRITGLPVALLVTARPWPPAALRAADELAAQDLAVVRHLAPLSPAAARVLLAGQAGPAGQGEEELARATALCAGNPLLLSQLAAVLQAGNPIPGPAPGGISWARRLLLSHLAGIGQPVLAYLRAAAVLGRRFQPEVAARVAGLGAVQAAAAQETFASAGLGRLAEDGWAEFGHELIRQAVYEQAAPVRARLHEAAFRVLAARGASPAEAAGHAVAARLAGDPQAIDVLARAGSQALATGAVGAAVGHLLAAAELAGPDAQDRLVFELGRALGAAGDHAAAMGRQEELLARPGLPVEMRLAVLIQLSHSRLAAGQVDGAAAALEEALRLAGPEHRDLAAGAMVDHAAQVLVSYGWSRAEALSSRARELAAGASVAVQAAADGVWAVGAYFAADPASLDVADAAARTAAAAAAWRPSGAPWWDTVAQYAAVALSAERFADAQQLLDGIIDAAQRRSDPLGMAIALMFRARVSWRLGQLGEALELSARLNEYTDLAPVIIPLAAVTRAMILLDLGRLDEAADWSARATAAVAGGNHLGYNMLPAHLPPGTLALRSGDPAAAAAEFDALWQLAIQLQVRDPGTIPWAADAISAYLACGRDSDAGRLIDWLAPAAQALPARWAKAVLAAGQAALADRCGDADRARERYAEAVNVAAGLPIPLARAQVLTDYGRFLLRAGDARPARSVLAEALRLAEDCGGAWHAEQARVEWRRAGGRTGTTPPGQLTPQEAAVARLARAGKTNREIAAQLFLTVNTVETHLRHVYQKLGIHRRAELITLPGIE